MAVSLFFICAFLLGSIPNAYLAGRLLKNIDIRQHGSGNAGATNVFRVLGKKPGVAVFFLDFLKGASPAAFFILLFPQPTNNQLLPLLVGLSAVLGHMFTPFLGFKGGKGVATASGVIYACFPALFAVTFMVWVSVFFLSRIVSISSIAAALSLYLSGLWTQQPCETLWVLFGILLLVVWSHRANILRLIRGQEHRWS